MSRAAPSPSGRTGQGLVPVEFLAGLDVGELGDAFVVLGDVTEGDANHPAHVEFAFEQVVVLAGSLPRS